MSKKCIKCGTELDEAALFCDECGTQQVVSQTPSWNQVSPISDNLQSESMNQMTAGMKNSGFGIASLVLGIISICTLGAFIIPEILGLVFGIIDMAYKNVKHACAIAGIVTSIIAVLIIIAIMLI